MKKIVLLLLILTLSVFSGCTPFFSLPNETVKAPRTTGEYEEIQKALINEVGSSITMKYPKCKGTSASFTTGDVDGDGEGEILAFYQPVGETATHINILKIYDGKWKSVAHIEPAGSELNRVEISDLDQNGAVEILTGWSVYDSKNYELAVYSFGDGKVTKRMSEKYTDFMVSDYNLDGTEEAVVLLLDADSKTSKMMFYKLTARETKLEAVCDLNGTVMNYSQIYTIETQNGEEKNRAYFVDGFMGNGTTITEAVVYSQGKAQSIIDNSSSANPSKTYRHFEVKTKQNENGVFIPFVREIKISGVSFTLVDWMRLEGMEFVKQHTSYCCLEGGYEILIEDEWDSKFTVTYDSPSKTLYFYTLTGEELFRVIEEPLSEETNDIANAEDYADMVRIKTGETSAYFTVVQQNSLNINTEKMRNNFILME